MENIIKNKIKGCLYGFAVGDAMGMPYESYRKSVLANSTIKPMKKSSYHKTKEGSFSDETSLLLATVDSIVEREDIDFQDLMEKYSDWLFEGKYTIDGKSFAIMDTVFNSINKFKNGIEPTLCGDDFEENSDLSAVVRVIPVILYLYKNFGEDFYLNDDALYYLFNFVELTNKQDTNMIGIFYLCSLITNVLSGKTLSKSIDNSISFIRDEFSQEDSFIHFDKLLNIHSLKEENIKSENNIVFLLESVTYSLLKNKNYDDTILFLIGLGGKTDSYSAVGGAIAGMYYGYENINSDWIKMLRGQELFYGITTKFIDIF